MKDVPGVFWILCMLFLTGAGVILYSRSGSQVETVKAESVWENVEAFQENLTYRRVNLVIGPTKEHTHAPYRFSATRLTDSDQPSFLTRYILRTKPLDIQKPTNSWIGAGIEVGLDDLRPGNVLGSVHVVAMRRLAETQ